MLPKIHKPDNSGRPIVSAFSCPTENISAYLDEVMAPFVKNLPTYIKDTNHALRVFNSFSFDKLDARSRFLFTMDIKSLYTVIPNDGGLEALAHFLDQRTNKEPPTHTLTRLAELVLTLNAFSFNGQHYRQTGGVAMSTKMGPNYACLFVGFVEEQIYANYTSFLPQLHKRYIDEVVGVAQCTCLELEQFIDYVCNFHPALQLTFTISELELPFLDIKLSINGSGIQTSVYYKETDTHNYLHHTSFHPQHCKQAIPYSQFLRLRRICSNDDDFKNKAEKMRSFFSKRSYPEQRLNDDLQRLATISRDASLNPTRLGETTDSRVPLVLTYHPFNTRIRKILLDNFNILSTDPETCGIFPEPPLVSYRRNRNLRDILVHSTDGPTTPSAAGSIPCRRPLCQTCQYITSQTVLHGPKSAHTIRDCFNCQSENVVYCITCRRCTSMYIGETGRRIRERFSEHLRSIRNRTPGLPVAEQFNSTSHSIDNIMVCGVKQCTGNNLHRKRQEMKLIFTLGTLRPSGLNINFNFF